MKRWQAGFTIIEVVLFLALSGVLIIQLLVGVNAALRQQQYRDTVQSFAGFLRDQYSRVINVENDRGRDKLCPITHSDSRATDRGQSNCVIAGRYIISIDGRNYRSYPLYAAQQDKEWLYGYDETEVSEYTVGWGAQVRFLTAAQAVSPAAALVMYRHPTNGQLAIHVSEQVYAPKDVGNLIYNRQPNGQTIISSHLQQREFCVYDPGWSVGQRLSVFMSDHAGSAEAITTGNATKGCDNERTT